MIETTSNDRDNTYDLGVASWREAAPSVREKDGMASRPKETLHQNKLSMRKLLKR